MDGMCIYIYHVVQYFRKKFFLRENIIVKITAYSVNIFIDTFLIREIKNMKILFSRNLVPQKFGLYGHVYFCVFSVEGC